MKAKRKMSQEEESQQHLLGFFFHQKVTEKKIINQMVLEYITQQKQDICSSFSSSYGTFTKIDPSLIHSPRL